ncbi:hypothetical protein J5N97_003705 [Dioscorea zingiberensis]|uniref:Protein LURP-one-related 8 n=1 Tax=Dioscorea zingiberensis TaxID=325984 RepID=A0A9D5D5Z3_9LILI|nr:hypothetical protein J5N97_003705 [Dioscorea zingiberensis]
MTKVHPNYAGSVVPESPGKPSGREVTGPAVTLTVWHKSLLFNCNGFTVFDNKGNLVFRVDNYASSCSGEVVLMDAAGKPLLTVRRKRLISLSEKWLVYNGEEARNPRFCASRKHMNILSSKSLTHISSLSCGNSSSSSSSNSYDIEGSYMQRSCMVYDERHHPVVEIKRKESVRGVAFGADVFRLVVQPEIELTVAMAMVILLEQMFGSRRSSLSLIRCS